MPASAIEIANVALRKLGTARITSLEDATPQALAISDLFAPTWRAELRKHAWIFATARVELGATLPAEPDYAYRYDLPADCLRVLEVGDPDWTRWERRGRSILTDDPPALPVKYVQEVEEVGRWDDLFAAAISSRLAEQLAETVTASSTAVQLARADYKDAIREAKRANAIEKPSVALTQRYPYLDARL